MIKSYDGKPGHGMTLRPRVERESFQRWVRVVDRLNPIFTVVFLFGICVGQWIQLLVHLVFS